MAEAAQVYREELAALVHDLEEEILEYVEKDGGAVDDPTQEKECRVMAGRALNEEDRRRVRFMKGAMVYILLAWMLCVVPVGSNSAFAAENGVGHYSPGANAFYRKQFTGDHGSGAVLGPFKGSTQGIGPVLSYVSPPIFGYTILAEVKWLSELSVDKRLSGDYLWVKAALAF